MFVWLPVSYLLPVIRNWNGQSKCTEMLRVKQNHCNSWWFHQSVESWLNLLYQSLQLSVTLALPHVINVSVISSDRRRFCSGTRHAYARGITMFSEWHPMDDRARDLQDSWICRHSGRVQCPSSSESSKRHGHLFFEGILHTQGLIF